VIAAVVVFAWFAVLWACAELLARVLQRRHRISVTTSENVVPIRRMVYDYERDGI
jgi:hypothetical protein